MKVLIVYDSIFGNTEEIARAIGSVFDSENDVEIIRVSQAKLEQIKGLQLLIVGSPTRAFNPTGAIKRFLRNMPGNYLKGIKVAAFDTGISLEDIDSSIGRAFINVFGYAAKSISDKLRKKGGKLILPPQGFFVEGTEGPLKEGEFKRAAHWGNQIIQKLLSTF